MKAKSALLLALLTALLCARAGAAESPYWIDLTDETLSALSNAGETIIEPIREVPRHVVLLLKTARDELGYTEGRGGVTKYGEWAGDPKAEWCAEYLCWCVDRVDSQYGTNLLTVVYPRYSSKNIGMRWFLKEGRYIARRGTVPNYGSQWYIGHRDSIGKNGYIPQPGDWAFFAGSATGDTTHVAMVEFCTKDKDGTVRVYTLEGNKPDRVQQTAYLLTEETILGYGTVFDLADLVLKAGCESKKVLELQQKMADVGLLDPSYVTGVYGTHTADAVRDFQRGQGIEQTGVAGHETQLALATYVVRYREEHPAYWAVTEPF